jgi:ABC-type nitrate/sulfonate/bicarbonate transport system permease component
LIKKIVRLLYPFIVVGIIWEIIFRMGVFPVYWFPSPIRVTFLFWELLLEGSLIKYSAISIFNTAIGFLAGASLGLLFGIWSGVNKAIKDFVSPLVAVIYPIPGIAWLPLILLWFGFGYKAIIFTVGLGGFFSVFYNTMIGVENINPQYKRAAQSMGFSRWLMVKEVYFFGAFPFIWSGLKLGYGRAWRTVIAGEMLSFNIEGLGWFIWKANEFFNFDELLVGVLTIGLIGLLIERSLFTMIEKKYLPRWA